jgi:hypothetical protein
VPNAWWDPHDSIFVTTDSEHKLKIFGHSEDIIKQKREKEQK